MPAAVALSFTTPPSANRIWRSPLGQRRVILSPEYRRWRVTAGWEIRAQKWTPIKGPFEAVITVPEKVRGDLDNRSKGALDLLQRIGVIEDDKHMTKLTVMRGGTEFRVTLWIPEKAA